MMSADEARDRDLGCARGLFVALILGVLFGLPILLGWVKW